MPSPETQISLAQVRAHWLERQGLTRSFRGDFVELLQTGGWMNSAGAAGPYLAYRARVPSCKREDVDRVVFGDDRVIEVPALRGCSMLVPLEDVPLALHYAQRFYSRHFQKVRAVCRLSETEITDLSTAVTAILRAGSLSAGRLRESVPQNLIRTLDDDGRRLGESSTFSIVVRMLQIEGRIRRFATDRRLDSQRYSYELLPERLGEKISRESARRAITTRFFEWASPARLKEFAWWCGMSVRDAREAVREARLIPVRVPELQDEAWILPGRVQAVREAARFESVRRPALLPFRDNYHYFRRGLAAFTDAEHRQAHVFDWRNRRTPLDEQDSLHHHAIIVRGKLAGFWEYDPEEERIVWKTLGSLPSSGQEALSREVEDLESFIRSELGDVRLYAMDTGRKRRERIDSLRA